jgi:hypothetical protein
MKHASESRQVRNHTLVTRLLSVLFVLMLFMGVSNSALAADTPPASEAQMNAPAKGEEPKKGDCEGPPVVCVPISINLLSYPGCTSGQRCNLATTGQSCGQPMAGTRCQTVNNNGACTCQCIK